MSFPHHSRVSNIICATTNSNLTHLISSSFLYLSLYPIRQPVAFPPKWPEILCRLLRFWDSRNIKRGNKFMGIIMLFLDEKVVVSTKSPQSEKQYVWKSVADSTSYVIREETDPQKFLRRGMQISKGTLLQLFTLAACFEHCVDKYRRLVMSAVSPQANIDNILLRNAGSNRESTGVYFQAALKLLLALSMPQIRALPDPRKSMAAQQNFAEFSVLRKN